MAAEIAGDMAAINPEAVGAVAANIDATVPN